MKIYSYDGESKEFLLEGKARINPVESELTETLVWLLPANATFKAPPENRTEGTVLFFKNDEWIEVVDNRGVIYRKEDAFETFFNELGEEIPEGYTRIIPCEYPIWNEADGHWRIDIEKKRAVEKEEKIGQEMYRIVREQAENSLRAKGQL